MRIASFYIFLLLFILKGNAQQFFPVKIDNQWGLIDGTGSVVVQPDYEAIGEFKNFGYAVMQRNGGVGLLGKNAQEIISPNFDDLKVLSPSLVAVMKNQEWAVVNLTGLTVLPAGYERVRVCEDRFLAYMRNGKWGAVNLKGKEICSPKYDEIGLFESNFWLTRIGEKYGLLNLTGQTLLSPEHDEIRVFNDKLFFFGTVENGDYKMTADKLPQNLIITKPFLIVLFALKRAVAIGFILSTQKVSFLAVNMTHFSLSQSNTSLRVKGNFWLY